MMSSVGSGQTVAEIYLKSYQVIDIFRKTQLTSGKTSNDKNSLNETAKR